MANNWFEIVKGDENVYAFCEHKHAQWVHSFLILGKNLSVLFDTGLGVYDIREVINQYLHTPLMVVSSHAHFDHIGNNHLFDNVYGHCTEYSSKIANNGISHKLLDGQYDECNFADGYPGNFDGTKFEIKPYKLNSLADGQKIDLGDRELEILYTPGHSDDCIMLWDKKSGNLFTGDSYYSGGLYLYFNDEVFGKSDIFAYYDSIKKVISHCQGIKKLCVSHNPEAFHQGSTQLFELKAGLDKLMSGKLIPEELELPCGKDYYDNGKCVQLTHCSLIYR